MKHHYVFLQLVFFVALVFPLSAMADTICSGTENTAITATTPTTDFHIHANGTVTHKPTGLMWMRCSLGQTWDGNTCTGNASMHTWQGALQAVQDFNNQGGGAGYTDWRLPSINEIQTLVERRCANPAIHAEVFPATPVGRFWCSSPQLSSSTNALFFSSDHGWVSNTPKTADYHARLVRTSGESTLHPVSTSPGPGGGITPPSREIVHRASTSFTLTPDIGYGIDSVSGCGGTRIGSTYSTGPITSPCTVSATFIVLATPALTAQAGDGQASLSWATVFGADNYALYYGSSPNIDPANPASYTQRLETGNVTDYTATDLINDTEYYFILRPMAAGQEAGVSSNEISARPVAALIGTAPLNDTGIDWWADETTNNLTSPVATHPDQDADFGRDAAARAGSLTKTGSGAAGFDFTKLGADGQALSNQSGTWSDSGDEASGTKWSCVRDNHTGLIWEVKVNDASNLRHKEHTYTWYNPDAATNGGNAGTQNGGTCTGSACDTLAFVTAVNAAGLCGATDWRMPTKKELLSIVHYGRVNPSIDTGFFPNTQSTWFWSSSSYAGNTGTAWGLGFGSGYVDYYGKDGFGSGSHVRLVRAGQ